MLRVEGPVVAQNQMLFASDWLTENPDTPLDSFLYFVDPQPKRQKSPQPETEEPLPITSPPPLPVTLPPNGFAAQVFLMVLPNDAAPHRNF